MIGTPDLKHTTRSGRASKRPREMYVPDDFEDAEGEVAESGGEDDELEDVCLEEEEEEESDTSLSGFIAGDDEDDEYEPTDEDDEEDEEEDSDDSDDSGEVSSSRVVKQKKLISMLLKFSEDEDLDPDMDEAGVLAKMVEKGYQFPFLSASEQLKLFPYYQSRKAPPLSLVKAVFHK